MFAIADLHFGLSRRVSKAQERFGPHWARHTDKVRQRWREVVGPEDTVLVAGDLSWAERFEEAQADLWFLESFPGTKVLVRGNHDYWWPRGACAEEFRETLPPSFVPLHESSYVVDEGGCRIGVVGTCGWPMPPATPADDAAATAEAASLRASVASLPPVDKVIGMLHVPPFTIDEKDTVFSRILKDAGARLVVYGHVHQPGRSVEGMRDGVRYRNVAADQVDFTPWLLEV